MRFKPDITASIIYDGIITTIVSVPIMFSVLNSIEQPSLNQVCCETSTEYILKCVLFCQII